MARLSDRDRRLAHEIAAGVLRGRRQLDARLRPLVSGEWRRLSPDLRDILRIGAYQILRLGRVPRYAAVDTAVSLARDASGRGAAGLVNAVLRRFEPAGIPAGTGATHPAWLVDRWTARYGPGRTEALLQLNDRPAPLVLQPARWSPEQLASALAARGVPAAPAAYGLGWAVEARRVNGLPGYDEGGFVVQDPAQALVLRFAALPDGALVWDACAAPGGKAVLLAQRCRVIASDSSRRRVPALTAAAARVAPGLPVLVADARRPPFGPGTMDAVLIDAPCSATGTMARHPDARWRLSPRRIEAFARRQAELLDAVAPVVARGGILVYATCSLEPEENEVQVERFLTRHSQFRRTAADFTVFPADGGSDGAFAARLERCA